jgi:GT2 family glycosyltransferase
MWRRMSDRPLGVVILTHGRSSESVDLCRQLVDQGVAPSAIAVVQNPTTPDDPAVEPPHEDITVLRQERNQGYAAGMNAGIRHQLARDVDFVLTLTHEVRFRPGALDALIAKGRSEPGFGVLGPTLWWAERDRPLSFGGRRRPRGGIEHIQTRPDVPDGIVDCDWIDGAAMLYRRDALERAGLLEERFFIYVEDAEICNRIRRSGRGVGVVLDAVAEASPGGDTRPGAWFYLGTRNGLEYARRAGGLKGVAWEGARRAKEAGALARSYVRADAGSSERNRARMQLTAIGLGGLDFVRRRWGPPPQDLSGIGDVGNAGSNGAAPSS